MLHASSWFVSRPARHVNDEIDEIDKLPIANRPVSPHKSFDSLFRNLNNTQLSASSEPGPTSPAVANMNDPGPPAEHQKLCSLDTRLLNHRRFPLLSRVRPEPATLRPLECIAVAARLDHCSLGRVIERPLPGTNRSSPRVCPASSSVSDAWGFNIENSGFGNLSQGSYPESAPLPYPPQSYGPFPADVYQVQYTQEPPRNFLPQALQAQPQPPSPSRKSMFDFVSPFDIVPILLGLLSRQDEDADEDKSNVSMAAATVPRCHDP
ncbi:hypothetical protein DFH11DRAFT_1732034 [Phellopilus nigrolimitatus]|nr:hypothetical protein DFH11DRAFT_1732034 [Phellopilus nigrolimitatus]